MSTITELYELFQKYAADGTTREWHSLTVWNDGSGKVKDHYDNSEGVFVFSFGDIGEGVTKLQKALDAIAE
jgi:hypothetical protein